MHETCIKLRLKRKSCEEQLTVMVPSDSHKKLDKGRTIVKHFNFDSGSDGENLEQNNNRQDLENSNKKNHEQGGLNPPNDNVIPFPQERVRRAKPQRVMVFDLENKKMMVSASLLSFLFLVSIVNSTMISSSKQAVVIDGRGIASVESVNGLSRNTDWEHHLADELAGKPYQRGLASIARKPTAEDDLLMGLLQGKYSVKFNNGKLKEIQFSNSPDIEPRFVQQDQFFKKYKEMMPDYETTQKVSVEKKGGQTLEVYQLIGKNQTPKASVVMTLDSKGRLLTMQVEPSSL